MSGNGSDSKGWPDINLTGGQTLWLALVILLMGACFVRDRFNPPVARKCKTLNLEMSKEDVKKHMSAFPITEVYKPGYGLTLWFKDTAQSIAPPSYAHFTDDGSLEDFSCGEGYGMRRHEPILKN